MNQPIITDEQVIDLASRLSLPRAVQESGITETRLRYAARRLGVAFQKHTWKPWVEKAEFEKAESEFPRSLFEYAKKFSMNISQVSKHLDYYGIVRDRKPHIRTRVLANSNIIKIVAWVLRNPSGIHSQCAKEIGCSREYVSQIEAQMRNEGIIP
jgi:transcriptional regulator with XRE-family HTH domain